MATTVTIQTRNRVAQLVGDGRLADSVGVSYRTPTTPSRLVYVDAANYRDVVDGEPLFGSPIAVVPNDDAGQAAEDDAIRKDLAAAAAFTAPTRDI